MIDTSRSLIVPASIAGQQPIVINLEEILIAERRQEDVATVNQDRAPELLATFNKNWLELSRLVALIASERNKAEKELNKRRSIILIDLMTERLAAKGLSSSADNREAIILLDETYIKLSDIVDEISAILELIRGKMKSFDNAFTATKRIITQDTYMQYNKNTSLSGDTYSPPKQTKTPRPGFGTAGVR